MKIESSNIAMQSQRYYAKQTSRTLVSFGENLKDISDLSEAKSGTRVCSNLGNDNASEESTLQQVQKKSVFYLFELLFGARKNWFQQWSERYSLTSQSGLGLSGNYSANGLYAESYTQEVEQTTFSASGTIVTSDGREIDFGINLSMSRSFEQYYAEEIDTSVFEMCDPLVINLDTDIAELSDQNFYFDLDCDGSEEEIAMLKAGSGYLALDKNADGVINDGSELFGAKSQDGFADLSAYDDDGNGWIDENDEVFSKLKIWTKDASGNDKLYTLAEKGVGAICLSNASTNFMLRDINRVSGAIRKTGLFLYESGEVGTIQHVDVADFASEA